jgi:hypothetical protein
MVATWATDPYDMDRDTINSPFVGIRSLQLQQGGPIADQCEVKLGILYPAVPEVGIPFRRFWRLTTNGYAIRGSRLDRYGPGRHSTQSGLAAAPAMGLGEFRQ